ncbi:MAG: nucleotide exchange factor GrpE [Gammaproteobacteria bacterium]
MEGDKATDAQNEPETTAADETVTATEPDNQTTDQQPEDVHVLLEDARNKADEHWNQFLRLQAEMENLRKRNERDVSNAHKFALEKFSAELLPIKDSLEMGIAAATEGDGIDAEKILEGSELTLKMLGSAFSKFNVKEISPLNDKFNPEYHEAISMQERADVEPNTVVTVIQKGYTLNDRLIRPAMVVVSRAASEAPGGQIDEQA